MWKALGKRPFPHQDSPGLLFLVRFSAQGTHSYDFKLCPSKNVNASRSVAI